MPVSFEHIPDNWRVPLYWVEIDPSKAGLPINLEATLLVGTKTASGTAPADIPVPVGNQAYADQAFGRGSELANMFRAFFANNFSQYVLGLPVAEPAAGTAASGTITVNNAPTQAGTFQLYVAGVNVPVGVAGNETVTTMAAAIVAAITANPDLPVTATNTAGVVTVTAKWKGTTGNNIDLRHNYFGAIGGEQ